MTSPICSTCLEGEHQFCTDPDDVYEDEMPGGRKVKVVVCCCECGPESDPEQADMTLSAADAGYLLNLLQATAAAAGFREFQAIRETPVPAYLREKLLVAGALAISASVR
jgi:hypothetical protein